METPETTPIADTVVDAPPASYPDAPPDPNLVERADVENMGCAAPPPVAEQVTGSSPSESVGVGRALGFTTVGRITVGRIVHYQPRIREGNDMPRVIPAIITRVWSPICVNLRAFNDNSDVPSHHTSVMRRTAANESFGGHWDWPQRV